MVRLLGAQSACFVRVPAERFLYSHLDTQNAYAHRHAPVILRHLSYHDELPHDIDSHDMDADALHSTMAQGFDSCHAGNPITIFFFVHVPVPKSEKSQIIKETCKVHKFEKRKQKNYFTSSDPHHDMSGGGCQVGVVRVNWKCYLRNLDNSTYHPNS